MARRLCWPLAMALLGLVLAVGPLAAQDDGTTPPASVPLVHAVQEGETLVQIATQYEVALEDLLLVNGLDETALIFPGQELVIPGGEGEAVPVAYTVAAGDTLAGIAADFRTTVADVAASNYLIHPFPSLAIGQSVSLLSRTGSPTPMPAQGMPHVTRPGDTLLTIAAEQALPVLELARANGLAWPAYVTPGQRLRLPGEGRFRLLPGSWLDVQLRPQSVQPGDTISIFARHLEEGEISGQLAGQTLRFSPYQDGYVALVGLDAFTEPGRYELELTGMTGRRVWRPLSQPLQVSALARETQYITVGEELAPLLDLEVRRQEDAFLSNYYTAFTEPQRWEGLFQAPITGTVITANYGGGRSYNGGPVEIFHTGADYGAAEGVDVMAPAAGTVLFSDEVTLRGNLIILDHGLGVMTAYFHLSERAVAAGDEVAAGQPIGVVGNTGLSSGPHLHWELRIMDVPVDPLPWTQQLFPAFDG